MDFHGVSLTIERPVGSTRSGTDRHGNSWTRTMLAHYGRIDGQKGADGEAIDFYLNPEPVPGPVVIINQVNQVTGGFDEHKVMFGYRSITAAVDAYLAHFPAGWRTGAVRPISLDGFKAWLEHGDATMAYNIFSRNATQQVFQEEEHPRKQDGKFTKKGMGEQATALVQKGVLDDGDDIDPETVAAEKARATTRRQKPAALRIRPETHDDITRLMERKHGADSMAGAFEAFGDWESHGYFSKATMPIWDAVKSFIGKPDGRTAKWRNGVSDEPKPLTPGVEKVIHDVIRHSQDYAKDNLTDEDGYITVYRGILEEKVKAAKMHTGAGIRVANPKVMESWTLDPAYASGYAIGGGLVLRRKVRPEDVAFVGDFVFYTYNNQAQEVTLLCRDGYSVPAEDVLTSKEASEASPEKAFVKGMVQEMVNRTPQWFGPVADYEDRIAAWHSRFAPRLHAIRSTRGIEASAAAVKAMRGAVEYECLAYMDRVKERREEKDNSGVIVELAEGEERVRQALSFIRKKERDWSGE